MPIFPQGELDILEGVNDAGPNAATLHTTPGIGLIFRYLTSALADCMPNLYQDVLCQNQGTRLGASKLITLFH